MTKTEDKVNRRNVERLLNELSSYRYGDDHPDYARYMETERELEALEKKLLDVPDVRKLRAKVEILKQQHYARQKDIRIKTALLRQRYYAGVNVQEVLADLRALVEEANTK